MSRFRIRATGLAAVAVVVALAVAGSASANSSKHQTIEWNFMATVPPVPGGPSVGNFELAFTNDVYKQTKGQLKITLRPPGELPFSPAETLQVVGSGQVQMGDGAAFIAGQSPSDALLQMPFLITNSTQFRAVLPKVLPFIRSDFSKFGAAPLFAYAWPSQTFFGSGSAPTSLKDLSGKKLRVSTESQAYLLSHLGGTPVTLTTPDVAPALQRGVVDGVTTAAFNAFPSGWGQFLKWEYLTPINITPGFIAVNSQALASLSPSVRATLLKVAKKWQDKMLGGIPTEENLYRNALASKFGVRMVRGNSDDAALGLSIMKPYWSSWAASNNVSNVLTVVQKTIAHLPKK